LTKCDPDCGIEKEAPQVGLEPTTLRLAVTLTKEEQLIDFKSVAQFSNTSALIRAVNNFYGSSKLFINSG